MDMKFFTTRRVQYLVIAIASALIVFGAGNAIFNFMPDSALADKITDGLFISGVVAYMWSWKLRRKDAVEAEQNAKAINGADSAESDGKAD